MFAVSILILAAMVQRSAPEPAAASQRYAILVASSNGNAGEPTLRYATRDSAGVADVLTDLGSFDANNIMRLDDPSSASVQAAFEAMRRRVRADASHDVPSILFVYFSGHADTTVLHLGGDTLSWKQVLDLTNAVNATSRVLVIDACRSGEATLQKGTRRAIAFALPKDNASVPVGLAILASASAGESSQESPRLRNSFFTFHLISALRGAADFNKDGKVTLTEAFQYSSEQTAVSTSDTVGGVQHATYRYQMRGRNDLVMTQPSSQKNLILVDLEGTGAYVFQSGDEQGLVVLETNIATEHSQLWLPAGTYYVRRRTPTRVWGGQVAFVPGLHMAVALNDLRPVNLQEIALKGSGESTQPAPEPALAPVPTSTQISVWGGTGSPLVSQFRMPAFLAVQVTQKYGRWAFDGRLVGWSDSAQVATVSNGVRGNSSSQIYQAVLLVGARVLFFDTDDLDFSAGLRIGPGYGRESITPPASSGSIATRAQWTFNGEAVLRFDYKPTSFLFVGIEGSLGGGAPRSVGTAFHLEPAGSLGVGVNW